VDGRLSRLRVAATVAAYPWQRQRTSVPPHTAIAGQRQRCGGL